MSKKKADKNKNNKKQLDLFTFAAENEKARDELKALLSINPGIEQWRGFIATPAGSLLETVVAGFKNETNIPLEIPFFATLSMVSSYLLGKGVSVDFAGQIIKPDLWTVILADSGAGKTFATNEIKKTMQVDRTFPECVSGAAFVQSLDKYNNSIWIRDEFGQFLKTLDTQQGAEIKDYLLRVFGGDTIERSTKTSTTVIINPALSILGMTVLETFADCIDAESLLDGFAQRFSYVIAKKDPERGMIDFPIFDLRKYRGKIKDEWENVCLTQIHDVYDVDEKSLEAFKTSFSMLAGVSAIPESFYRRILFKSVKYAMLFHFLNKNSSKTLTPEDFAWAGRVSWLHLCDASELLRSHVSSDLERTLQNVESVVNKIRARGERVTPRLIVQGVRAIKTVAEAKAALAIVTD